MKILVVEDELSICNFLRVSLESEYFSVDVAHDGEEGLRLLLANEYDVVILDNQLPKMSGRELCRCAREKSVRSRIIGVSVLSEVNDRVAFLNAGADDYMTKPFALDELVARIRAMMRRPIESSNDVLHAQDLELNTRSHTVQRGLKEVQLTRKEFMLLEYLMRNKGSVLSRGMILDHVWDINADPFSYTIEAHIMSLRKKLQDNSKSLIKTVTGVGYKLME